MSTPGIQHLTKSEIVWRATNTCEAHGHSYLDHPNCFIKEQNRPPRLGFLDIETTNLKADFGIMLSYCIKEAGGRILEGVITPEQLTKNKAGDEDRQVVKKAIQDLGTFDKIVTYYGKRFDVPFLRTRALTMGIPFPNYGALKHIDLYDTIKHRFRLSSSRLEQACRVLLGDTNKTKIEYKFWRAAARGDKGALKYIITHNRFDVIDLERLFNRVINFSRKNDQSI